MSGRVRWEDWAVNCGQLLIVVVSLRYRCGEKYCASVISGSGDTLSASESGSMVRG